MELIAELLNGFHDLILNCSYNGKNCNDPKYTVPFDSRGSCVDSYILTGHILLWQVLHAGLLPGFWLLLHVQQQVPRQR